MNKNDDLNLEPAPKEFTPFAVFLGLLIGIVMTAANVYLGLYAGMTVSAAIPAAVISMGVFVIFFGKAHVMESNIVKTMASAGESLAAGIIFTLPALVIIGAWSDFKFWPTTLIAITGGIIGILFMIPLRRALIVEDEELSFPEGVASAVILEAGDSNDKTGFFVILKGVLWGGLFKIFSTGTKWIAGSVEAAFMGGGRSFFFGADISPALLAVGYIVELEVALLVFIGGVVGWSIGIPLLGVPAGMENLSALDLAWELWSTKIRFLGVGAMIVGGVWSIISVRKGIMSGVSELKNSYQSKEKKSVARTDRDMSLLSMAIIFGLCLVSILGLYHYLIGSWGATILTTAIMIFATFILVAVSSYIVGLVGSSNNPVSGITISALLGISIIFLVLGYEGQSAILATLGVASIVCCAVCTAGDISQDLKTGFIVKATPKYQQWAQMIGVLIPAFVIAPILSLLHHAYGIGQGLKAPQATLFASITGSLFGKGEKLPYDMIIIGAVMGVVIIIIDKILEAKKSRMRLYLMPLAVGIYLPVTLAIPMLVGGIIRHVVNKKHHGISEAERHSDKGVLLSSGLIAGEAIMGVVLAVFIYFNIDLGVEIYGAGVRDIVSILALAGISWYLWKISKRRKS